MVDTGTLGRTFYQSGKRFFRHILKISANMYQNSDSQSGSDSESPLEYRLATTFLTNLLELKYYLVSEKVYKGKLVRRHLSHQS